MRWRGPDGEGLWLSKDQRVGLVHRRLSIIDLSPTGCQPMCDQASGTTIVFNGEIYNHRELRCELEAAGHRFDSTSDTEVLLKLYAVHGIDMTAKLRGMYAFAIWDDRCRELFLARDPLGIKPLYYSDDGKSFRFASQVKALLASGEIDDLPDPSGQVGFFLWGHVPEPFTLFKKIRALPAGSSLRIGLRRSAICGRHFNLAERIHELEPLAGIDSPRKARSAFSQAVRDTVRHHLIADVPVGVFLSSGIDSSAIFALASEIQSKPPVAITLGFSEYIGTDADEVRLAKLVAQQYDADHRISWVTRRDFENSYRNLVNAMDQPTIDGVNMYFVCKAAREAGLKAALSGVGGDEILGGYSDFTEIPRLTRALQWPSRIPGLGTATRGALAPLIARFGSPKYASLLEYGGTSPDAYLLRRALFLPWELPRFLDPDLVRAGLEGLNVQSTLRDALPDVSEPRLKVCSLVSAWYMRNQLLRDADWASMAHSIELRTPLADTSLWETVIRIVRTGYPVGKQDLALTPTEHLPDPILKRTKTGFSIPVREWLTNDGGDGDASGGRGLRSWAKLIGREFGIEVDFSRTTYYAR